MKISNMSIHPQIPMSPVFKTISHNKILSQNRANIRHQYLLCKVTLWGSRALVIGMLKLFLKRSLILLYCFYHQHRINMWSYEAESKYSNKIYCLDLGHKHFCSLSSRGCKWSRWPVELVTKWLSSDIYLFFSLQT